MIEGVRSNTVMRLQNSLTASNLPWRCVLKADTQLATPGTKCTCKSPAIFLIMSKKNRALLLIPTLTTFMLLSNTIFFQHGGVLGKV